MRAGTAILVGGVAICALVTVAVAQPFPDGAREAPALSGGGTRIPVTMPGGPEVMEPEDTDRERRADATSPTISPSISLEQPIDPATYVCGPGDVFELHFWGRQNFRLRVTADLEGRAFITKVGFVEVAHKTLAAVRTQITKKVRANYPGLSFDLTLVTPRTFVVHVVDNVKAPGTYPAQPTERVAAVLGRAGGVTRGSRRKITIHRAHGADVTADLVRYELTGDTRHNPVLLDGDVVRVPFAELTVTITGAVRRPGTYELVETKDLAELLDLAGGLTSAAARRLPVRLIRRNDQQQEVVRELAFAAGRSPNAPLRDDDTIVVRGAEELQRSVLLIGAVTGADAVDAATTSRRLPYVEGDTVLSIIDRAGGIRAPGDLSRSYVSRPAKGGGGAQQMLPIDLEALLVRRDFTADKPVFMGDTIVVPPMRHSILVEGAVSRAGLYTYNPRFGIPEYIAQAGGRTRTARDLDEVKLIGSSGATRAYRAGVKLSPGDSILVPERNFSRPEIVQLVIATAGLVLSGVAITIAATR